MSLLSGVIYCTFWYTSILAGYAVLYCPILPVLFVSNKWYRMITDYIFRFWELLPTAMLNFVGTDFVITGDRILHSDRAVLIVNHRTRTDWNFLWPIVHYAADGSYHNMKYLLKNSVKNIPGPGWVMQLSCFLYIRRRWEQDRSTLKKVVQYISALNSKCHILIFPEGTDMTPGTLQKSHQYADKFNLQKYYNVLHPRTAGFCFLVSQLQKQKHLDAIYDLTIVYSSDSIPQTEIELFKGLFPKKVYCDIKRYSKKDIPTSEDGLKTFLTERWKEKELKLQQFQTNNRFDGMELKVKNNVKFNLILPLLFWCILPFVALYLFLFVSLFRTIVLSHTAFIVLLTLLTENFLNFEIYIYFIKKKIIRLRR